MQSPIRPGKLSKVLPSMRKREKARNRE
jgi:hypothetical protein